MLSSLPGVAVSQVGIQDLNIGIRLDIRSRHNAFALKLNIGNLRLLLLPMKLLEIFQKENIVKLY